MKSHKAMKRLMSGFTLIELVITVVIIGIIAAIAFPNYAEYMRRNTLTEAITNLHHFRLQMEQSYQNNRTYIGGDGECAIDLPEMEEFTFACGGLATRTFTITALNKANHGLGDPGNFEYSLNQDGVAMTAVFEGVSVNKTCLTATNKC